MHIFSLSLGLLIAPILASIELPVTTYFNADWINLYTGCNYKVFLEEIYAAYQLGETIFMSQSTPLQMHT